ncbi:MAG: radical SAM protein [bacterium]|nr:radical SAM protein [bacterium]
MENKIINVGIRLTRQCNMKCMYCNIQNTIRNDLTLEEWKKAIDIIKKLGSKEIVILGGEPTLYPNIIELVHYITIESGLVCNLTTNAYENFDIVKKLIENGLNSLGVSVDNLNLKKSISPLKSKNGLALIDYLINAFNKPSIINYIVLNKCNVDSIIDLIKYMNNKNVVTYILPFHWGNEGTFDHRKNNEKFAFVTDEDIKKYTIIIDKIIEMKNDGYKIKNSVEFLKESKKYIKNLDWKCSGLSELRIDSDGRLVCCCDKIGNVNEHFTVFDLEDRLEDFYFERAKDATSCNGCLWPSSFEAELKRKKIKSER